MSADLDALTAELARLDLLLAAEMQRMRARYELSLDEFHGLYITDQRVDSLLRSARQPPAPPSSAMEISDVRAADTLSRWRQLAVALQLDEDERDLLLLCLAPELDAKYETLFAYLNDDVNRRSATGDLALRLFGRDAAHRLALRGLLLPSSKLLSVGAVEVSPASRDDTRCRRMLRATRPLADWVQGLPYVDERILSVAKFAEVESRLPTAAIPAAVRALLDGLVRAFRDRARLPSIVLSSDTASDAAAVAEELFARAGRPALVVDVAALRSSRAPDEIVAALDLAQLVLGVGIIATPLEALVDADRRVVDACLAGVRRLARRAPVVVFATGTQVRARTVLGDVNAFEVPLPRSTADERAAAWRHVLRDCDATIPASVVDALADRFALGVDRIRSAAFAAREAAVLDGQESPSAAHLFLAARAISAGASSGTTQTMTTPFEWEDLVLPLAAKTRLAEMVNAVERRSRVLDDWGFARRVGGARGIKVMFSGPSGTGKTMAATIVAKKLELDLHRLEIGSVVSKYIGETEKNLDRAFEAARRANAVLFIDEADALLGKRSQVKDAHDRYANVEIAYLLQKMEDHEGVVIVATNLAQNIDEAFSRRMQYVIDFPLPDAASRERLWRGMFPASAPLAPGIDFTFLGRQFELSGGDIRNIVLDAAFRAARDDGVITFAHLLKAIARQYEKRGSVPTAAEFREHYAVLAEEDNGSDVSAASFAERP